MIKKYLNIIAECCKKIFGEMTQTEVVSVRIKPDERPKEIYAVAKIIHYEDINKKLEGSFVLGFPDESTAILVASAIAENLGLPPVSKMEEEASDILDEFINIIVGRTISEWDKVGLRVKFDSPNSLNNSSIQEKSFASTEAYIIILTLEVDSYIVFRVTFNKIK
jgi:CheY-specific phosphatase CheX